MGQILIMRYGAGAGEEDLSKVILHMESMGDTASWCNRVSVLLHGNEDRLRTLAASLQNWRIRRFVKVEPLPMGASLGDSNLKKLHDLLHQFHASGVTNIRFSQPDTHANGGPCRCVFDDGGERKSLLFPFDAALAYCEAENAGVSIVPENFLAGATVEPKLSDNGLSYKITLPPAHTLEGTPDQDGEPPSPTFR